MSFIIILVALFVLMWLLLIRPQRRRQSAQLTMQDSVRTGQEVITAGGLHGIVKAVEGEVVHLEIAPGTLVRVDRRAIAGLARPEEPDELEEPEELPEAQESAPADETRAEAEREPVPPGES